MLQSTTCSKGIPITHSQITRSLHTAILLLMSLLVVASVPLGGAWKVCFCPDSSRTQQDYPTLQH